MSPGPDSIRDDAFELFMAEAGRVRLTERTGHARITLRSGTVLTGELTATEREAVDGQLHLIDASGRRLLVSADSVAWISGASAVLRDESTGGFPRSLAARLRECWTAGGRLRALLPDGTWIEGSIVLVGADHIELSVRDEHRVVPFATAEAWDCG